MNCSSDGARSVRVRVAGIARSQEGISEGQGIVKRSIPGEIERDKLVIRRMTKSRERVISMHGSTAKHRMQGVKKGSRV